MMYRCIGVGMEAHNADETVEVDGEEYTASELKAISDQWEEIAYEALNRDDEWGYNAAKEKMLKAESARKELRNR